MRSARVEPLVLRPERDSDTTGDDFQRGRAEPAAQLHLPTAAYERNAEAEADEFGAVYERHLPAIYNYLRSRTENDEDAADLAQPTFAQALHALPRYDRRGVPIEVWLFRIARNLAVAAHRSRRRARDRLLELDLDLLPERLQPAADAGQPEEVVLQEESRARLRALLLRLDPDKRELLVLRFASRLTAREIGLIVGKSAEAMQKQITRTLLRLGEAELFWQGQPTGPNERATRPNLFTPTDLKSVMELARRKIPPPQDPRSQPRPPYAYDVKLMLDEQLLGRPA